MENVPTPVEESRSGGLDGRIQRLEEVVHAMSSEVSKMSTDMAELKAVNSAILDSTAQMLALWRKMAPVEPILKADFPIRSIDHLKEVDEKIYGKMEKYVSFQNRSIHRQTLTAITTYIKIRKQYKIIYFLNPKYTTQCRRR